MGGGVDADDGGDQGDRGEEDQQEPGVEVELRLQEWREPRVLGETKYQSCLVTSTLGINHGQCSHYNGSQAYNGTYYST